MKNYPIAIIKNKGFSDHSTNWADEWINYCENNNIDYQIVDIYKSNELNQLKKFKILLWHFGNYVLQDMIFARSIIYSATNIGLTTFPNFKSSWHFDDKIAETYILQSVNAPIPISKIFYRYDDCESWLINEKVKFPLVAKLRCGSGSHNVKLLKNKKQVKKYAKRMFSLGLNPAPSIFYKATSNIKSVKNIKSIIDRFKRIPEFINNYKNASLFPNEKGYVFFQEFIPNDGYDLKIVVVGDKLGGFARKIREGDFRASGGGSIIFDKTLVSKQIIHSAFSISDSLGFDCMGYDYVVDKKSGKGIIVEISYGFSHKVLMEAGGYFNRDGIWINEPLNAPEELLKNILNRDL